VLLVITVTRSVNLAIAILLDQLAFLVFKMVSVIVNQVLKAKNVINVKKIFTITLFAKAVTAI